MSGHPPNSQLTDFLERRLPPEQVLDVDRHVAKCSACQDVLQKHLFTGSSVPAHAFYDEGGKHLSYEELRAVVDGAAPAADVKEHLRECALCEREFESLKQFAHGLHTIPRQVERSATPYWYGLIAAMAMLSVTGIYFSRSRQPVTTAANATGIVDGDSRLSLTTGGALQGGDSLPQPDRALLATVLSSGQLPLPALLLGAEKPTETMLGTAMTSAVFHVLSPLREVVLPQKPTFHWESLPGATEYRVAVYDSSYRKIAASASLTSSWWQSDVALERGQPYTWTVTATAGGHSIRVPSPPQAEARFTVMSAGDAEQLLLAQTQFPDHHLLLTTLYAREGDVEDAQRELALADASNPGNPTIAKLKASLNTAQSPSPIKMKPAQ